MTQAKALLASGLWPGDEVTVLLHKERKKVAREVQDFAFSPLYIKKVCRMRRTFIHCLVVWFTVGLVASCSKEDADEDIEAHTKAIQNDYVKTVFEGEWSVNTHVVDTARLETTNVLKLRLPEEFLVSRCFPHNEDPSGYHYDSASEEKAAYEKVEPKGVPVSMKMQVQGYSDNGQYNTYYASLLGTAGYKPEALFFYVTKDEIDYRIELLSDESVTSIYRADTGLWTIAIPIKGFLITNLETMEQRTQELFTPITIYYNAKSCIGH